MPQKVAMAASIKIFLFIVINNLVLQKAFNWFYENKCLFISFIDSRRIMDIVSLLLQAMCKIFYVYILCTFSQIEVMPAKTSGEYVQLSDYHVQRYIFYFFFASFFAFFFKKRPKNNKYLTYNHIGCCAITNCENNISELFVMV